MPTSNVPLVRIGGVSAPKLNVVKLEDIEAVGARVAAHKIGVTH